MSTDTRLADTIRNEGFRRVRIRATIDLDAYVLEPEDGNDDALAARIQAEIEDAVLYRAPHLTDTEEGDALITAAGTGHTIVTVDEVATIDADSATLEQVVDLAQGFAGEIF